MELFIPSHFHSNAFLSNEGRKAEGEGRARAHRLPACPALHPSQGRHTPAPFLKKLVTGELVT